MRKLSITILVLSVFISFCNAKTDIAVCETHEHQVHFTSDKAVYVEKLVDGQLLGCWISENQNDILPEQLKPAFEIEIKDDAEAETLISTGWLWVSGKEVSGTKKGGRYFVTELSNKNFAIAIKIHTFLDGTCVMTRWLEITNKSDKPVALTGLSPWSGQLWTTNAPITLGHSVKWELFHEGWFGWTALQDGQNTFSQHRGLAWDDPYFILRNESNGEYFFGQLAWPVNYSMEFQKQNGLSFKIGPTAEDALRVIAPNETLTTPFVHLGHIKGDFDATVQAMHDHVRRSVLAKRNQKNAYTIQCLFPEDQIWSIYRGDECNETNVKKLMDVCASVGIELFILDGPTWAEGITHPEYYYGNWVPKKNSFPNGLQPLVKHAHKKGLLFGVYAEVEGGRGDWSKTQAWAEHSEWFTPREPGFDFPPDPMKNFINLSIPEAAQYVGTELNQIIDNFNLDIYRHDQNGFLGGQRTSTLRDGFMESDFWRYYDAWHSILGRVRNGHPKLIMQQASGSGTRLELATISHWDENYTSDRTGYPWVYQMLSGLSVYLPPEILVTPHGMNAPVSDTLTMLRGVYALGNTPMLFNAMLPRTTEEFLPGAQEQFMRYAKIYKKFIRPILPVSKVYHHAPVNATGNVESGNWFVMEFMSPDQTKGWATIIRLSDDNLLETYQFKPKGLDNRKKYRVTFDNTGQTKTFEASNLMQNGLIIKPGAYTRSELLLFEAK